MTPLLNRLSLCLCVLQICVAVIQGETTDQPPAPPIQAVEDKEITLPCHYQHSGDNVVQVTWMKTTPDGTTEPMILVHFTEGQKTFAMWSDRVRFASNQPIVDSSLIIKNTRASDEGDYTCRVTTFPSGNFDIKMSLSISTIPISDIEPVVVVEGESFRVAATCRSVGHPPPKLSWDTQLNGQVINRSLDNGAVTTQFLLHPLRNMNDMKLDCLVWHPLLPTPRRIKNQLVVHFPPHADVSGYKQNWYVGKEDAALMCINGGNPKPNITWTRVGGKLPTGAQVTNESLKFTRPLNFSDEGTYLCVAKNKVGEMKAEVEITLKAAEPPPDKRNGSNNATMLYVGGGAGVLLILMIIIIISVTCYQKRKNKELQKELSEKKEEISLYRQGSVRRMNSVSTEARELLAENAALKVEGTLRTSLSSLGEQAFSRDSRSTISVGRERGGAYDSLGRPSLYNSSRRGRDRLTPDHDEEIRLRVERFIRTSNRSLQENVYRPPLTQSTFPPPIHPNEVYEQMNGNAKMPPNGGPGSIKSYQYSVSRAYPPVTDDEDEVDEGLGGPASQEHPDEEDNESSSVFSLSKSRSSPSMISPHLDVIHKAQIV